MPYNTNEEADAYFSARYGYDLWVPLDENQKTQALTSAQQMLDIMCVWSGEPTDPEQDYAFPRDGETEVPEDVKNAECEIAYNVVAQGNTSTEAGNPLSKLKAGSVELNWEADTMPTNPIVNDLTKTLLRPYGLCDFDLGSGTTKQIPSYRG